MRHVFNTLEQVVDSWLQQYTDPNAHGRNRRESLYFKGNILCSYVDSVIVALIVNGRGEGPPILIINGDNTASGMWGSSANYQWLVRNLAKREDAGKFRDVTFSFSAFESVIDNLQRLMEPTPSYQLNPPSPLALPYDQNTLKVVDQTEPKETREYAADEKELIQIKKRLLQEYTSVSVITTYSAPKNNYDGKYKENGWSVCGHTAESVVLSWKDLFWMIGSWDGVQYFFSVLPHQVHSVEEAIRELRPPEVKFAMDKGMEVLRQGEWFFIKECELGESYRRLEVPDREFRVKALPKQERSQHSHECRIAERERATYCTGTVYHRDSRGYSTREHQSLVLNGYYSAWRNTEITSATSDHPVD